MQPLYETSLKKSSRVSILWSPNPHGFFLRTYNQTQVLELGFGVYLYKWWRWYQLMKFPIFYKSWRPSKGPNVLRIVWEFPTILNANLGPSMASLVNLEHKQVPLFKWQGSMKVHAKGQVSREMLTSKSSR